MGQEVPNINGGFGKGEKSMLAKDIAEFHNKETWRVNEDINNNLKNFRTNIDIIDLKRLDQNEVFLKDLKQADVLTQAQIGNAKNIYLLSERGYAKLIKIFNDDLSWEMYDKLLDDYFRLKDQEQVPQSYAEALRAAADEAERAEKLGHHKNILDKVKEAQGKRAVSREKGISLKEMTRWLNTHLEEDELTPRVIIKSLTGSIFKKTSFGEPYKQYKGHWFFHRSHQQEVLLINPKYLSQIYNELLHHGIRYDNPHKDLINKLYDKRLDSF